MIRLDTIASLRFDDRGLVPVVAQHVDDGTVLMVGYMNAAAIGRSIESGDLWFWSRSRQELWHKGETSGNFLRLQDLRPDCDGDTLLATVRPEGPTCHTGARSCFDVTDAAAPATFGPQTAIARLWRVIVDRRHNPEPGSYTNHLLQSGVDRIARKIGEEAAETIVAAKNHSAVELTAEVSDLLYHTLVLMAAEGVELSAVEAELDRRHGAPRRHRQGPSSLGTDPER